MGRYTVAAHTPWETVCSCKLRGSTRVDISPRDGSPTSDPLYRRNRMRADAAPLKEVTRFMPDRIITNRGVRQMNDLVTLPLGGLAPGGPFGQYHPDGRVTFAARPAREWEFMATGTGVTGLTVNFPDAMVVQVNHSAAIDEGRRLRALGRLHLDLDGRPLATATAFRMEHDLRRSLITAVAETAEGPVKVEIRAHVPLGVIRLDIHDGRRTPGALTLRLEEDAPATLRADDACGVCFWHENPPDAVAPDKPEDPGTGADIPGDNRPWLAGRVFGLAVTGDGEAGLVSDRALAFPARARHALLIAGVSTLGGWDAFANTVRKRLAKARGDGAEAFVASHEAWWREFWARASFEPGDMTGPMLRHKAAFDLYRYYLACSAGEDRETPLRFQMDLFRYHLRQTNWLTGVICAVEQYQSFYGAMRTGDWGALRGVASFYARKLPYYRHFARRVYGHGGALIPMWQGAAVLAPPADAGQDQPPVGYWRRDYNGENAAGQIWMLALLCDLVDATGDAAFADDTLRPLATDLVEFIRQRYPGRENGRMVIAPCNAGETWQGVRDPSEMVCALRHTLPRLINAGKARGWDDALITAWEGLLAATPEVPRGRLQYRGPDVLPVILPGDQLVPAADMSDCQRYPAGDKRLYEWNRQHTELFAIWPAKLAPRSAADRDPVLRSYRERLYPHWWDGWNLDVVFAACLGLWDEVAQWSDEHFEHTFTLPCGLARETAPNNPATQTDTGNWVPESPSLQGMGTGVLPVLEMLLQDYPDQLVVLPCWPEDVPVSFALYSPYAGRVQVRYRPGTVLDVAMERRLPVTSPLQDRAPLKVRQ